MPSRGERPRRLVTRTQGQATRALWRSERKREPVPARERRAGGDREPAPLPARQEVDEEHPMMI